MTTYAKINLRRNASKHTFDKLTQVLLYREAENIMYGMLGLSWLACVISLINQISR